MEGSKVAHPVSEQPSYTEINMSRIQVGGGMAGLLFAIGTALIFAIGVPVVRPFLVGSLVVGFVISIALHFFHKYKPPRPISKISV
jgi:hypothetical protein